VLIWRHDRTALAGQTHGPENKARLALSGPNEIAGKYSKVASYGKQNLLNFNIKVACGGISGIAPHSRQRLAKPYRTAKS